MALENLEPRSIWENFSALNAVPRPSKREERVIEFMMNYGKSLGLETVKDAIGNVVIKKPATAGMEDRQTVILQSHLDMVHQKNNDTIFDFETEGIKMFVDGDWVKAEGTTLGADNGIGVATIMTVLASNDIPHPAIEALFTIDEETGMTGAKELDPSHLSGTILLNLDSEDDNELSIGCAGGIDTNTSYRYEMVQLETPETLTTIEVKGLMGGHSGMDIHKGRGNSNKLANRIVYHLMSLFDISLIEFDGGSLRNAIPREAVVKIAVPKSAVAAVKEEVEKIAKTLKHEFKSIEKDMKVLLTFGEDATQALSKEDTRKIVNTLYSLHNGVFRMSPDIEDLVETSSSLARVIIKDGQFITQSLQRSSVESTKADVANAIRAAFENMGATVIQTGDYPGWQPNIESPLLKMMESLYIEMYNEKPLVQACHAGLECGILGEHLPDTDMISFGPNIYGAHSPDERTQISSVQKFWGYFLEVLKRIPKK